MTSETTALAIWVAGLRAGDLDATARAAARDHLLDTLGALAVGPSIPGVPETIARWAAIDQGSPEATIFGSGTRGGVLAAAGCNAALAHAAEIDDIHNRAATCLGAMVVPSLLALAEAEGGDVAWDTLLCAVVAGYEAGARLGMAMEAPALFARGLWPNTVVGPVAAAAGAARLMGMAAPQVEEAIGLAAMMAGGLLAAGRNEPLGRHVLFGEAARRGTLAARLVRDGVSGPTAMLEGVGGMLTAYADAPRPERLVPEPGAMPEIRATGIKPWGCARQTQAAVRALLDLLEGEAIDVDAIAAIEVHLPEQAAFFDRHEPPGTRMAAVGSAQFTLALAAVRGGIDPLDFETLRADPAVLDLMTRVHVGFDADLSRLYPANWPARLRLETRDGRAFARERLVAPGDPDDPISGAALRAKFDRLATPHFGAGRADRLAETVMAGEGRASVRPLLDDLFAPYPNLQEVLP